jgi:diguanylate cyclase (GGDEF)-like protein
LTFLEATPKLLNMAPSFKLGAKAKIVAERPLDTRRFHMVVVLLVIYAVGLIPVYKLIGDVVFFLSLVPLIVAASLLGMIPALLVAVLLSTLNLYLYWQLGATLAEMLGRGGAAALLHFLVGGGVGRLADLQVRLKDELAERNEIETKLEYLAYHDPLTGLPNRMLFHDHLERELAHARRAKTKVGVLALNLERFRWVNDSYGHDIGDRLLTEVGHRIQKAVRQSDTVARLGSDTFVVMFPQMRSSEDISAISDKIQYQLMLPLFLNQQEVHIAARIGVAQFPEDGDDPETLLRNADAALNRAKQNATQTFQAYNPQINSAARERMQLETGIRKALQQEELSLHYQPIVDTGTGAIISFEALLRWNSAQLGPIPPDVFIPVAEDTGAIHAIGDWVFRSAMRQLRGWRELGFPELRMSVNISPKQLKRETLHRELLDIANEVGVPGELIELEITESSLLKQEPQVMENLKRFREAGMSLAVDDFGTGYSCLAYLKRMPFTCLKVDRSFIKQVNTDPEYASITYAIIAIAKALRMRTVAEGVETQEQCAYLWQLQCDAIQGYLFNKPMPADDCTRILNEIVERRQAFMQHIQLAEIQARGRTEEGTLDLMPLALPPDWKPAAKGPESEDMPPIRMANPHGN